MFVLEHLIWVSLHQVTVEETKLLGRGSTVQFQDAFLPFRMNGRELLYEPVEISGVAKAKAVHSRRLLTAFRGERAPDLGTDERGN